MGRAGGSCQRRRTHIVHGGELAAREGSAVPHGEAVLRGQSRNVHEPHLEEAHLDQDQLVVLRQLQEACDKTGGQAG